MTDTPQATLTAEDDYVLRAVRIARRNADVLEAGVLTEEMKRHGHTGRTALHVHIATMCAQATIAMLMSELRHADPERARHVAERLQEFEAVGDGYGELLYEWGIALADNRSAPAPAWVLGRPEGC